MKNIKKISYNLQEDILKFQKWNVYLIVAFPKLSKNNQKIFLKELHFIKSSSCMAAALLKLNSVTDFSLTLLTD